MAKHNTAQSNKAQQAKPATVPAQELAAEETTSINLEAAPAIGLTQQSSRNSAARENLLDLMLAGMLLYRKTVAAHAAYGASAKAAQIAGMKPVAMGTPAPCGGLICWWNPQLCQLIRDWVYPEAASRYKINRNTASNYTGTGNGGRGLLLHIRSTATRYTK